MHVFVLPKFLNKNDKLVISNILIKSVKTLYMFDLKYEELLLNIF